MPEELKPQDAPVENVTPPAEAAPPAAPESQPEAPKASPLVEKLTALGFENVESDEQAIERLTSAYEQERQRNNQISDQVKQALAELKETNQPTPPQTQASGQGWWNPPQVDESVVARYRTADGWKEGTPSEVRQSAEALEAYRERFARQLVANPKDALKPLLQEVFGEFFQQQYSQIEQARQQAAFFEKVRSEHGEWLWRKDPHTGQLTEQLTDEGARFNSQMAEFEQAGMPKAKAFEVALKIRNAERAAASTKVTSAAQAADINLGKKQDLLARDPGRNRTGSLPQPGVTPPKNRNLTFGQLTEQTFQMHTGS